jgi:hypothetical protein
LQAISIEIIGISYSKSKICGWGVFFLTHHLKKSERKWGSESLNAF